MRYHVPIRLRWADLDAYNHVNNSTMLTILEEARVRAFWVSDEEESPSPLAVIEGRQGQKTQTLISRHEIEYIAPIPYQRAPIDVQIWIGSLNPASADICYEVRSASGELYTIASSTIVFVDTATGRPRRVNEHERSAWGPYVEAPVAFRADRKRRAAAAG